MHYIRYDVLYRCIGTIAVFWAGSTAGRRKGIEQNTESRQCRANTGKEEKASALKKAENRQNEIDRLFAKCMKIEPVRR